MRKLIAALVLMAAPLLAQTRPNGGGGGGSSGGASAFVPLTDGATVTWANSGAAGNATLTMAHTLNTRALNVSGLVSGGSYSLKVSQDATGGAVQMTAGTGCTWLYNYGFSASTFSLPTAPNSFGLINFTYDGTNCILQPPTAFPAGESGTAVGFLALPAITTGLNNNALGWRAGSNVATGNFNDFFGHDAGFGAGATGHDNSAFGEGSLFGNGVASNNVNDNAAFGSTALLKVQNGFNSAFGYGSLTNAGNTQQNAAVGFNACLTVTTGSNDTCLGASSDVGTNTFSNATALGQGAVASASNQMMFGNSTVTQNVFHGITTPLTIYSAAGTALPTCTTALKGSTATVSDATAPTYMGAYTSGGGITTAVICSFNGTTSSWLTQ